MKDSLKLMLIPIIGSIAIAIIFVLIVWSGNFQSRIENKEGQEYSASEDIGGYAVLVPTSCDNSYFPVCGLDSKSYDNACLAVAAGTKVAYRGVCQA
jgi:hypothetical protein